MPPEPVADVIVVGPATPDGPAGGNGGNSPSGAGETKMGPEDYGMLKIHAHNGAQRQADGAGAYAENLRYDYLEGKHVTDFGESLGTRHITGPHPQYGSPDAPRG